MVFFIVLYTVVLTAVESVKRKSYNVIIQINITEEELSFDTVNYAVQGGSNDQVCNISR